jgi:chromosome segregation ATPase
LSKNEREYNEAEELTEGSKEASESVEEVTPSPFSFWEMLEERVVQLVRRIDALQEENAQLKKELVEKEATLKKVIAERDRLKRLKKQMRDKVERLIVKIEEYQEMAEKEELPKPPEE